ncbi:hypothetical protein IE53DRAFT_50759 [Violaceomyces palustris]|uniref:Uncharacterized protein n=1 Tax=Violaceomyces palustris TaxID=1673888 RepID=A0ACD0P0A1_9BASI|nr:hypothetical protein IE53DRAFT_50759 [Violaceomyces palustris]
MTLNQEFTARQEASVRRRLIDLKQEEEEQGSPTEPETSDASRLTPHQRDPALARRYHDTMTKVREERQGGRSFFKRFLLLVLVGLLFYLAVGMRLRDRERFRSANQLLAEEDEYDEEYEYELD